MHPHEEIIRAAPLLTRLQDEDLKALISRGRIVDLARGQRIFEQGDPGDALYVVIEGSVQIAALSPDGRELTIAILGPGECFGDLALLDGRPRSAGARAGQQTRAFVVSRQAFVAWVEARPSASRAMLQTLSLRLRQKDDQLADLALSDVSHRLAKRLCSLSITHSRTGRRPSESRIAITQSELAAALGVSRQAVNGSTRRSPATSSSNTVVPK
jgi:CRP-like cAMP-binding protein